MGRGPLLALPFRAPLLAQKAYSGLKLPSASSSDDASFSRAAQSESSSLPSSRRRLYLCKTSDDNANDSIDENVDNDDKMMVLVWTGVMIPSIVVGLIDNQGQSLGLLVAFC